MNKAEKKAAADAYNARWLPKQYSKVDLDRPVSRVQVVSSKRKSFRTNGSQRKEVYI